MRRHLFGSVVAVAVMFSTNPAAQSRPPQPTPTSQLPANRQSTSVTTVEGCLVNESDIPGRKPNVVERAGLRGDYILTNAKVVKGKDPVSAAPPLGDRPAGAPEQTMMYEVKGIDDKDLKKHVGKRVQIEGTFANLDQARDAETRRTPADDLVEIRGTTIQQVPGDCSGR
jgi:hypothetical protein